MPSQKIKALTYPLFFLALYTLIVKFLNPIVFFIAEGPVRGLAEVPIMWDFWWAIHIFLGICLLRREKFAWGLALAVSVAEIAIILFKFWKFWQAPTIDFWTLSWYVNKCFVLSYFICLFAMLWFPSIRRELREGNPGAQNA